MDIKAASEKTRTSIRQRGAFIRSANIRSIVSKHPNKRSRTFKFQVMLAVVACVVLIAGAVVTWQTILTNRAAASAVSLLTHAANSKSTNVATGPTNSTDSVSIPSTTPPTQSEISSYTVAPDLARYIKIPKISVYARVTQVGLDSSGAIGTPSNTNDTSWYTGSAKPGRTGATLIDGHVLSMNYHGVFHDLKNLLPGDNIQIVRGDGTILNYSVVTIRYYSDTNVDMAAALSPITPGKSGLNLITCAGKENPGTITFNQRLVVFAELK